MMFIAVKSAGSSKSVLSHEQDTYILSQKDTQVSSNFQLHVMIHYLLQDPFQFAVGSQAPTDADSSNSKEAACCIVDIISTLFGLFLFILHLLSPSKLESNNAHRWRDQRSRQYAAGAAKR